MASFCSTKPSLTLPDTSTNAPDSLSCENQLKEECARQENQYLKSDNIVQIFSESHYKPVETNKKRRISYDSAGDGPSKIKPYSSSQKVTIILKDMLSAFTLPSALANRYPLDKFIFIENIVLQVQFDFLQISEKESTRRHRERSALQTLYAIVPGVDDKTDDPKILELTAKYILYLKTLVQAKHDKEFLCQQII